jgi:hypothetical protein
MAAPQRKQTFLERISVLESVVKLVKEELEIIADEMRSAGVVSSSAVSAGAGSQPSASSSTVSALRTRGPRG